MVRDLRSRIHGQIAFVTLLAFAACGGDDMPTNGDGTPIAGSSSTMNPSTAAGVAKQSG